jgi:hypothetical protein
MPLLQQGIFFQIYLVWPDFLFGYDIAKGSLVRVLSSTVASSMRPS